MKLKVVRNVDGDYWKPLQWFKQDIIRLAKAVTVGTEGKRRIQLMK